MYKGVLLKPQVPLACTVRNYTSFMGQDKCRTHLVEEQEEDAETT
jgi:hypothetical protein